MARTKSFKDLVHQHVKHDKKFAEALLREGVDGAILDADHLRLLGLKAHVGVRCAESVGQVEHPLAVVAHGTAPSLA